MENNSTKNDGEPSLELLVGCKPFEGQILCSSDSVSPPDSEYGFRKSYDSLEPFI